MRQQPGVSGLLTDRQYVQIWHILGLAANCCPTMESATLPPSDAQATPTLHQQIDSLPAYVVTA